MNWKILEAEKDFDDALTESNSKITIVFKHSTRCPVSSMAKRQLEQNWHHSEENVVPNYLDLIRFRNVSNYIANKTHVHHESPQMIVFKNEELIHHASHHHIDPNHIIQ